MSGVPGDIAITRRGWSRLALATFLLFAGVTHFTNPDFFNEIVPPWLPPSESFWTYASGVVELVVAAMLFNPRWRTVGALGAIWLFIGVYPANIYMAWDWRDRPFADQLVAYGRLPLQFVLIWWAWRIRHADDESRQVPGDIDQSATR